MEPVDKVMQALDDFDPAIGVFLRIRTMVTFPTVREDIDTALMSYLRERVDDLLDEDTDFDALTEGQPGFDEVRTYFCGKRNTLLSYLAAYAMAMSQTSYQWTPWRRVYETLLPLLPEKEKPDAG